MEHTDPKEFWRIIDRLDEEIAGGRVIIDIDMQPETTFTQVSIGGHPIGEEVSCHMTGRTRCYLTDAVAA